VPTYQYACTTCGEQTEAVQRFSDDPLTVCPACGGGLRKVFSPVGIVFKGSGFYRTDSRNGSSSKETKESKAANSNGSADGSSTADKKPSSSGESSSDSKKPDKAKSPQPASAGTST
jgi:putative FmdB family regulatory protein